MIEEIFMSCVVCKTCEPSPGLTTVSLQRGDTTVIIKGVPAEICQTCSEYYLADLIARDVLALAERAVQSGE
ncbi:MAG: hypothetical protein QOJ16_1619 [Acidobacteriota bacterium]|jgi:YgiT-type zinc finger domain-containing protein|nr:hypothetical protein [Acidobacteriota bacterium]